MKTKQELFDNALFGIRAQGYERGYNASTGLCQYRGDNGTKCAIGHSIADDNYDPQYDSGDSGDGDALGAFAAALGAEPDDEMTQFMTRLQCCHDAGAPAKALPAKALLADVFEARMRGLAEENGLIYTAPIEGVLKA